MLSGKTKRIDRIKAGEFVYCSTKEGKIVFGKVSKSWQSGETSKIVKVTLDNGKNFRCTFDHLVMLRDGTYIEAGKLRVKTSLMPLYVDKYQLWGSEYERIYQNDLSEFEFTHRLVASYYPTVTEKKQAKARLGKNGNKYIVVHHKNNKYDNRPTKLQYLGNHDHYREHALLASKNWKNQEYRDRVIPKLKKAVQERVANGEHNFVTNHPMLLEDNRKKMSDTNKRRLKNGDHPFLDNAKRNRFDSREETGREYH
jgi:tRNA-splicing ligase RtcB